MASTHSDDDIKKMTVAQLTSYLTDRKVTLPAARGLKQTYVDLALEEVRKERAGIKPPPEPFSASRMQSPQKTPAKSVRADTSAERTLISGSDSVEPTRDGSAEEPPVVLLPLPTPPPPTVETLVKGLVLAVGVALIAIAIAAVFRFVYDEPEPEPATYLDVVHSKILELLHLLEKRLIEPAIRSLGLSAS